MKSSSSELRRDVSTAQSHSNHGRRWLLGVAILATIVAIVVALSLFNDTQPDPAVRIGYQPLTVNLPLYVAVERGYFNDAGIEVELVRLETTNQITDALLAGRLDMSGIIALYPVLSIQAQQPGALHVFSVNQQTPTAHIDNLVARTNSGIESIPDLRGKRLGIFPGSSTRAIARVLLRRFRIEESVTLVELAPAVQVDALNSGQVDALLTLEPMATIAVAQNAGYIAEPSPMSTHLLRHFTLGAAVVRSGYYRQRPDQVDAVIAAWSRALAFIDSNPQEARRLLPRYTPLAASLASEVGIGNIVLWQNAEKESMQSLIGIYASEDQLPQGGFQVDALALSKPHP